jgi:DNA-directed RNA polymerase I, II, and III subunit RPABC5
MIIPIRCFGCGKVTADKWNYYEQKIQEEYLKNLDSENSLLEHEVNVSPEFKANLLDELDLTRYCCRSILLTHIDLTDKI